MIRKSDGIKAVWLVLETDLAIIIGVHAPHVELAEDEKNICTFWQGMDEVMLEKKKIAIGGN